MKRELKDFIPPRQLKFIRELENGEEGDFFTDKLDEIHNVIQNLPEIYSQDGKGDEAVFHMHWFVNGCDWFLSEVEEWEEGGYRAFGWADLGYGGELGYFLTKEVISCGAELDLHWTPKTLGEIKSRA